MPPNIVFLPSYIPDILCDIRYYSTFNFVGTRIDGYLKPYALLTEEAAASLLRAANQALGYGYRLLIFDAYRPQRAVNHFSRWADDALDTAMKPYFYPKLDKKDLFDRGYILRKSAHSRASTVDLTLFDMKVGTPLDMGSSFDFFGERSHSDYTKTLSKTQIQNRTTLKNLMVENGFAPLKEEWWHFTLVNEPYPDTYFDFPISEVKETRGYCKNQ